VAGKAVTVDVSQMEQFFASLDAAGKGDFRKEVVKFMEALAEEFLRIVEDEIIRRNAMDTRLLLNSFHKNSPGNVWIISSGGTTLEVGTNVEYAAYVNDGHWTNPKGVNQRWVPGSWSGDRFVYDPEAKTGMLLKQKWVEGKHYWEGSIRIIEQLIPKFLEAKMDSWLAGYFGM
jgi:hypothetical protein